MRLFLVFMGDIPQKMITFACFFMRISSKTNRIILQKKTIMFDNFKKTLKSSETDDWMDTHIVRPLGYCWALLFARLHVSPNGVTIISMFIGASAAIFFYSGSYHYEGLQGLIDNILAIVLLLWANVFDCTDGQLARMTGQKSRIGRILDGASGFIWFIPIYTALVLRFYNHHSIEFGWLGIDNTPENALIATLIVLVLGWIAGFSGMGAQSRIADYYIQIHLFLVNGKKGSELDNSEQQQRLYDETPWEGNRVWKSFLKTYVGYTRKQEKRTPEFQRLMACLKEKYGSASNMPEKVRKQLHRDSLGVMRYVLLLPFNFRIAVLILLTLMDVPVLYFVFECTVMEAIARYAVYRHEAFCRKMVAQLTVQG